MANLPGSVVVKSPPRLVKSCALAVLARKNKPREMNKREPTLLLCQSLGLKGIHSSSCGLGGAWREWIGEKFWYYRRL